MKTKFGYESCLRVGKVLAPYNVRPKMVPLIKIQMDVLSFKYLFFKIIKRKKIQKKQKMIFVFWTQQGLLFAHTYLHS